MNVGVGLPTTLAPVEGPAILEWARQADRGPFSSLGILDRLVYHSLDPLATLAACVGVTSRIRLAATVVAGPLRNDALLAKSAATIDVLSGGRLTLGLALGARREEYDVVGAVYSERGHRLTEQLGALRRYWESDRIGPAPVQPGGPELLVGGLSDHAYGRAARFADGYIHAGGPPRAFARAAGRARAAWAASGRAGEPRLWAMGYFALGDRAADAGRTYLLDYYAFIGPFAERVAEGLLTTPQAIAQFIRGYSDAGCDELILFPAAPGIEQLERLAQAIG